jgi:hypothetical protein
MHHSTIAMMLMKDKESDILESFPDKAKKKILRKIELLV